MTQTSFSPSPRASHPYHVHRAASLLAAACAVLSSAQAQTPTTAAPGTSGYHLEATWKIGGDGGWDYLSVDPAAHRLYVARQNRVQVIDTDKGTLLGEVPGLDGAHGVALATEFNRGFASSGKSDTVIIFDLKTLKAVGEPVAVGKKPDAIIYDPASKHVFSFNGGSDDASVIDAATGKVVATIALGGGPEFAAADGKGTVFVNLEDKSETLAIDSAKNTVAQRWPLAPGTEPTGLSLDAARHRLFAGCHNEKMIVLDSESGQVAANLPIGKGVDATAFDPGTGLAFSSNGDGTLTVIGQSAVGGGLAVVENVKTQRGSRTMGLDTQTHAIYLAAAGFEESAAPATGERRRPQMTPGSFSILKFARPKD